MLANGRSNVAQYLPAEKRNLGVGAALISSALRATQAGPSEGKPMAVTQVELLAAGAALTLTRAERRVMRICYCRVRNPTEDREMFWGDSLRS